MATLDVPRSALRDRLVRVAEAATTPLVPADILDLFAPLRAGAELLGEQGDPGRVVVGLDRVEQAPRPAGVRRPLDQVRDQRLEVVDVEHAVHVVVPRHQAERAGRGELAEVAQEDGVGLGRRDVDHDDVEVAAARQPDDAAVGDREEVAQHADHGGDAGAGGHEEQLARVG